LGNAGYLEFRGAPELKLIAVSRSAQARAAEVHNSDFHADIFSIDPLA
jgi:hypothetical protein